MDIDPKDLVAQAAEARPAAGPAWLNSAVAITVALLATFTGICKVKDDNLVQAMQQSQADKLDHWQYYQARNIREEVARATLVQLRLQKKAAPPALAAEYDEQIEAYEKVSAEQKSKKEELRKSAERDQANYDAINYRDDQFDLSDACIAIAISLLAVTSLTQLRWLFIVAMIPSGFGVLMGMAGLMGWHFHPDALIRLLS